MATKKVKAATYQEDVVKAILNGDRIVLDNRRSSRTILFAPALYWRK